MRLLNKWSFCQNYFFRNRHSIGLQLKQSHTKLMKRCFFNFIENLFFYGNNHKLNNNCTKNKFFIKKWSRKMRVNLLLKRMVLILSCFTTYGHAAITAQNASEGMGKGFNLGQMFESDQHTRTLATAKEKIDAYYAKGFRTMRIPVTWTENLDGEMIVNSATTGEVNRYSYRLAVIESIIDYALSLDGLYVVLNAHHEKDLKTYNRYSVLEQLWDDISDIFSDRSYYLMYEILNEPHLEDDDNSAMDPDKLRYMTGLAYDKIRSNDPNRIIIIGGNQWFNYAEMATVWTTLDEVGSGDDNYVMATFHHYSPWSFCGNDQGSYDDSWDSSDILEPIEVMQNWADGVGEGMPIYIGEWGVGWGSRYEEMECNNIRLWYQMFYNDIAAPKSIPASVWDDGGWFKIFDHDTGDFDNNLADCISGSCDWDSGGQLNDKCS